MKLQRVLSPLRKWGFNSWRESRNLLSSEIADAISYRRNAGFAKPELNWSLFPSSRHTSKPTAKYLPNENTLMAHPLRVGTMKSGLKYN